MSLTIDETRVEAFVGLIATDVGAALNTALVAIGDRLGLYRAMADAQPVSAADLAARTSTQERYVREWLNTQAASGYLTYDAATDRYTLPAEHAFVLADESSPLAMAGMFHAAGAVIDGRARVEERFRSGGGVGWHEHDDGLFCGTERAFAANYRAQLVQAWLPALDGVVEKLERGARVADVGCGHGASAILMAQAFPASTFDGFDTHAASIDTARRRAAEAGVDDRVRFTLAAAHDYPGEDYDLVCFFDALHDMGDPAGAARHSRAALAADGTALIVEPYAGDRIEENLNPVGRFYYGMSTLVCTPGALAQPGGVALGTQAGEARLTEVLRAGGFTHVRRAAETPLNLILEARP
ncbi:class I SAM-dependent methyltransferase [Solirubrobacter ginsenosidimutans]|uniref:Class I SAM-dependent methyltransferase n=1 Tax=Solirubrobacter ginsenosidimutans TaxID=490573 RepID=A0A9X3S237_9ACTN|nr:class I SAM-dependent methyltransferase [Solirubrobacter ginsenosidimutans]MDA0160801.1 class I SAM-dependent methyltransferase [Solirubrobacter ginsenosidimutans]